MEKDIRCTKCRTEFSNAELGEVACCPNCQTKSVPMTIRQDVEVRVNVHELRILCIWAENHAIACDQKHLDDPGYESMKLTVNQIAIFLEKQIEEKLGEYVPLTLTHELQELPSALKKLGITHGPIQLFRGGKEELIDEELS
jgi:hypothetical protein